MKTLLGIPVKKLDYKRYIKQLRCIITWKWHGAKGTIEAATGFGKSILGCLAIMKMVLGNNKRRAIIIVPTIELKKQWEGALVRFLLGEYADVYVINTIALKDVKYKTDLLILDEIHLFAADQFRNVFHNVSYNWILGLTATIDRLDGKHVELQKFAPVVYTITQKEAIANGWINDFVEVNVPVYLTRDETQNLDKLNKKWAYYMAKFNRDFDIMRDCMNSQKALAYVQANVPYKPGIDYSAMAKGLQVDAINANRIMQERKKFFYNTEHKVEAAVEIINEFGLKTITFSQSTAFADRVREDLGKCAVAYHSNLSPEIRMVEKTKVYKTESGAMKAAKLQGRKYRGTSTGWEIYWKEPKKFGVKTLKEDAVRRFSDNKFRATSVICTAKALDQGFDVPDVQLGVDASRTSNPTQHTQRTGRIARKFFYKDGTEKQGLYVNLYVPDTRDEEWLRKCQKNSTNVVEVYDTSECIELIKNILCKNGQS